MNILDWIIIGWLVLEFILGIRLGFAYRFGNLIGVLVAIFIAGHLYEPLSQLTGGGSGSQLFWFMGIVIVGMVGAGILAHVLNKMFKIISFIPFPKSANRMLGGLLSLLTHSLFLAILMYSAVSFDLHPIITDTIAQSPSGSFLAMIGGILAFLSPQILDYVS